MAPIARHVGMGHGEQVPSARHDLDRDIGQVTGLNWHMGQGAVFGL